VVHPLWIRLKLVSLRGSPPHHTFFHLQDYFAAYASLPEEEKENKTQGLKSGREATFTLSVCLLRAEEDPVALRFSVAIIALQPRMVDRCCLCVRA
jgi:hypothetical protein